MWAESGVMQTLKELGLYGAIATGVGIYVWKQFGISERVLVPLLILYIWLFIVSLRTNDIKNQLQLQMKNSRRNRSKK
jgi:hypothetical protein